MSRPEWTKVALLGVLFVIVVITYWTLLQPGQGDQSDLFAIHFLDVGQGDAALIETPDGHQILIDGGAHRGVLRDVSDRVGWFDRDLDLMIATHPDTDHVGGLIDVLGHYEVDLLLMTEVAGESPAAVAFAAAVAREQATVVSARAGQVIELGPMTSIHVLGPASDTSGWKPNTASIIVKVIHGDTAFLLTGDAPSGVEDYLADTYGVGLRANVLKLGHHGSKTSTSEYFLATVDPQFAVVSAGLDNRYGHPHQSVLDRVSARNIQLFHTGLHGTVSLYSDGAQVWDG